MKRTVLYLFFFITHYSVTAQQQAGKSSLPISDNTDSVQFARLQLIQAFNSAGSDTARAINLFRTASGIFKRNNLPKEEGECYLSLADIYFEAGQYNRSFANYVKAQDAFYEVSPHELALATLGVAKAQYHRGLYRFAIKNFADVVDYSVKNNDEKLTASAAEYLGVIFSIFQSNSQSKKFFTSAYTANWKLNDDKGCLRIAEKLFNLNYQDRQFDSALWYSDISLALAGKLHQQYTLQTSHLNRIAALVRLMRLDEGRKELNQFEEIQVPQSDLNIKIRFEVINANFYMALRENKKAVALYDSAIRHASATNTPDLLAVVYSNMADSYAEQHDYEKAFRFGLKYFDMMTNFYSNSISHLSKIESLIKEDVANSKIKYLNSINKLKELRLLREHEIRQNLIIETRLKDSILQKEKQLHASLALENKYNAKQLGSQLQLSAMLNNESRSQKKQLQKELLLRGILITGLICLLFLGVLTGYQYRRAKVKNKIIEKQAAELQILMKEIHHRVKNNLQIISSLLDIQSLNLANNPAAQAIREGKNRVQSMAIIHQYLYHENNIRGIKVGDYIKNLSENLFSSYNINPDNIKLETDIDMLNLDVDTMIPLGLIINELFSNSLKYAFAGPEKGTIFISLKEKENCLNLMVRDNGRGFPSRNDIQQKQTFGLQLIAAFAQKLKAKLEMFNDHGAVVLMSIKKYKMA
jgi:two-component sensor histidine kinase